MDKAISIIESLLQQEQRILNGLREVYGTHSREVLMQSMTIEALEEALRKLREDI